MTGGPGLDSARVAVEWGALSYLIKPLSMSQLQDVLSRAVQMHRVARRERRILHCTEEHERELEAMRLRFDRALAGMWTAFQPIVSWSNKNVVAYEALMRTTYAELCSPLEILKTAEALDQMPMLGRKTRGQVAEVMRNHPNLRGYSSICTCLTWPTTISIRPTRPCPSLPRAFIWRSRNAWRWRGSPTSASAWPICAGWAFASRSMI